MAVGRGGRARRADAQSWSLRAFLGSGQPFTRPAVKRYKRARRRIIHHPKFFLFDAGVFRAIRPRGPLDSAIEVKRKRSVVSNDLNGLKAFASEYPEARRLLFYGGEHEAVVEGVRLVPFGMAFTRMEELVFG